MGGKSLIVIKETNENGGDKNLTERYQSTGNLVNNRSSTKIANDGSDSYRVLPQVGK